MIDRQAERRSEWNLAKCRQYVVAAGPLAARLLAVVKLYSVVERQQTVVHAGVVRSVELRRLGEHFLGKVTTQQPQHGHVRLRERVVSQVRRLVVLHEDNIADKLKKSLA